MKKLVTWLLENDINPQNVDIDKMAEPTDTYQQQALYIKSEIHTYDDLQYCLDKALQKGALPLRSYLKSMRSISSKQFKKKALLEKVLQNKQQNLFNY